MTGIIGDSFGRTFTGCTPYERNISTQFTPSSLQIISLDLSPAVCRAQTNVRHVLQALSKASQGYIFENLPKNALCNGDGTFSVTSTVIMGSLIAYVKDSTKSDSVEVR